ncbi:hypothetical protein PAPYR_11964 [Paratrimastix pyriformis]|uniref:Uncharacterized protein n=1 Tax=Paratrimastix pyriformis TaxID=342808 RepID=A0ABQ8U889_9EUKA|nr:hypothetical protein PAPYR_11964 [Paratrimastix pyriformis]
MCSRHYLITAWLLIKHPTIQSASCNFIHCIYVVDRIAPLSRGNYRNLVYEFFDWYDAFVIRGDREGLARRTVDIALNIDASVLSGASDVMAIVSNVLTSFKGSSINKDTVIAKLASIAQGVKRILIFWSHQNTPSTMEPALPYRKQSRVALALNRLPPPVATQPVIRSATSGGHGRKAVKISPEKAWENFMEAGRKFFLTDWRGLPEQQQASQHNLVKTIFSYAKADARSRRAPPKNPQYMLTPDEKARASAAYHSTEERVIAERHVDRTDKVAMKAVRKLCLSASGKVTAAIRREKGHQQGWSVGRYEGEAPEMFEGWRRGDPGMENVH